MIRRKLGPIDNGVYVRTSREVIHTVNGCRGENPGGLGVSIYRRLYSDMDKRRTVFTRYGSLSRLHVNELCY